MLPVEAAARHGHLRVVELLLENGGVPGRALHFASAGGAADVAAYLLRRGVSPDLRVNDLSAVCAAFLTGQHRLVAQLLPCCKQKSLRVPIPEVGCLSAGVAPESTTLHLAALVGGLCEGSVVELAKDTLLGAVRNRRSESAFDLMPITLRALMQAARYKALVSVSARNQELDAQARVVAVRGSLAAGGEADALDPRGFTLLDLACFCGEAELVQTLLEARAPMAALGPTRPSALMWAHWQSNADIAALLIAAGASLSNADLEGLQRLRAAWAEIENEEATPSEASASPKFAPPARSRREGPSLVRGASEKPETTEASSSGILQRSSTALLQPDPKLIWARCAPCKEGYIAAASSLINRMSWGVGAEVGAVVPVVMDEPRPQKGFEFLDGARQVARPDAVAGAGLLAQRFVAEGSGLAAADLMALHLFLTDAGFHEACSRTASTLTAQAPEAEEADRAIDLQPVHAQLWRALHAIPARKVVCYRACRLLQPGGTLRKLLRGNRHSLDCYRPGSIVLWRHAASATMDPALAEEIALRGEPVAGCGVIFKIRRAASARSVAEFSEYPEHREVAFPPGSAFRIVGLFPCTERAIRRGIASDADIWQFDVGTSSHRGDGLSWEDACRARSVVVVLDEEDAAAIQRADGTAS